MSVQLNRGSAFRSAAMLAIFALALANQGCNVQRIVSGGIGSSGPRRVAGTVDKTVPNDGIKRVDLSVEVGDVKVTAEGEEAIHIIAVRRYAGQSSDEAKRLMEKAKVVIEKQGDSLIIKDIVPDELKSSSIVTNISLDVEIHMPVGLALNGRAGVGNLAFSGSAADLTLDSGVGDINLSGKTRNLIAKSGVGDVRVSGLKCTGESAEAHTGTGDVKVELSALPKNVLKAETGVGNVTVAAPGDSKASVQMSTGVGETGTDFPIPVRERGIGQVGGSLSGDINGGGTRIEVKSGTGDVRLKKK